MVASSSRPHRARRQGRVSLHQALRLNDQETGLWEILTTWATEQATRFIHNGGDSCLFNRDMATNNVAGAGNPLTVQQMRRICKNILCVAANSRGCASENLGVDGSLFGDNLWVKTL